MIEGKLGFTNLRRWSGARDDQAALVDASVKAMAGLDPRRLDIIVCLLHPPTRKRTCTASGWWSESGWEP